ncbi:transmembrane protein 132C [Cheilinus undulatus]|uniref:transmembrane protein 132C n=1 Tax=Cheilinus undulatus TaxID=241271 RepID=UPI001BD28604|nr:transmembrane protein 132C [Cheilinus undulatus]
MTSKVSWKSRGQRSASCSRGVSMLLLLLWIFMEVPPSLLQPPLSLSLPIHMSIVPPLWRFLPLSQVELGLLFSNSSPFSSSQSLFMLPPPGQAPRPGLQASFGPYSVTQLISEPVFSSSLSASLLSEHVQRERTMGGQEVFRVRVLFHKRGDSSSRESCITLHAFKETEEHKASCMTKHPLGLCVVTLTLPSSWFKDKYIKHSQDNFVRWNNNIHPRHRAHTREHRRHGHHHGNQTDQIQLFYSSVDTGADFELTAAGCVEERAAQSQRKLVHIRAVTLEEDRKRSRNKEEEICLNGQEDEELHLDSHVLIRYHRGPVLIGQPIRVSVSLRGNFSAEFVVIRLKVKKGLVSMVAQRTVPADLWTVTLERTQGATHDVVSILCHKHNNEKHMHTPSVLQQVVCLSLDGLRHSFGVAMSVSANWYVEYSGRNNLVSSHGAAVSVFSFTDRHIYGIAPITESNTIINTAILNNQPVSLPVIVLAVGHDGKVSDVTSAVACHSTNENTIKVSSDCSTLFVDGSESGLGNTCAVVEFRLGMLSGSVCLEVWAPSVPLRVSLADPILNAIEGWNHFTENGCVPVYQRSSIQVLTQFTAQDSVGGNTNLLGSSDWFVDVTELVHDWLRVEDPSVVTLGSQNKLIGLQPGKTSIYVVSEQWDGVLGRCDVTVTSEPVTPGDLSVQVVSGLGMTVTSSPTHPFIVTTTVTAYNILYNHHQEASISVWLQFSDDSASLLSSFSDLPLSLLISSLAESVVVVTPGPSQHIYAQGDGGGPLLRAELLVSTCGSDQPINSNSISEADWTDSRARRLARGSGWIRVNLDLGFLQPEDKDETEEELDFDISDTLVESDIDIYAANSEEDDGGNVSSDYDRTGGKVADRNWNKVGNGGMISRNNLERAVLMPSQEEGVVYFSPSQERGVGRGEEQGAREMEVGVGAVLSLMCLSAILFLVNCLPCALRERRRTKMEEETGGGGDGGDKGGGEVERRGVGEKETKEGEQEKGEEKEQQQAEVTEVEIIC